MSSFSPQILRYDSLTSTNTEAARLAQQGAAEGVTIVAGEQTAGRGRLERQWISPAGAGLYASIVLRPVLNSELWSLIPLMAALAVCDTLNETCELKVDIKWPNDILVNDRKLSGILAETVETNSGRAVILGIGINLTSQAFPSELREVATSIETARGEGVSVEVLLQSLLNSVAHRYAQLQDDEARSRILLDWMLRSSYGEGKSVLVTSSGEQFTGVTRGLESDGALRVETETGEVKVVRAADVASLRS
jgi:BirA family biotin operon repressor/biotin-[acetyl-CoA-carboxylase] ligase